MRKIASVLLIICIFLTGCGTKNPAEGNTTESSTNASVLRLCSYAPDTLNPILTANAANREMLNLIFEPLIWLGENLEPIPALATDWSLSEDGLVWSVVLRQNVLMHDGFYLTPTDVIASLSSAQTSPAYAENLANVSYIEAVGNNVNIHLTKPVPNFINMLEIPIVRSGASTIGTGCYMPSEGTDNKIIALTAFSDWWNPDKPHINNIEVHLMPDTNTSFFAFDAGEIDVAAASVTDLSKFTASSSASTSTLSTGRFTFLMLNNSRAPLSNADFRKAISHAIDKEKMSSDIFGSHVAPASTFLNPAWSIGAKSLENYSYDIKKAQELTSALTNTRTFDIIVNSNNESRIAVATFIASSLKDAGIKANVRKLSWNDYTNAINSKNYDAFVGEISLPPNADASFLFGNSSRNYANYSSADMDFCIDSWQKQTTRAGLAGGYYFIQEQYIKDLPFISLFFESRAVLYSDKLESTNGGFTPLPHNIYYGINYWQLSR